MDQETKDPNLLIVADRRGREAGQEFSIGRVKTVANYFADGRIPKNFFGLMSLLMIQPNVNDLNKCELRRSTAGGVGGLGCFLRPSVQAKSGELLSLYPCRLIGKYYSVKFEGGNVKRNHHIMAQIQDSPDWQQFAAINPMMLIEQAKRYSVTLAPHQGVLSWHPLRPLKLTTSIPRGSRIWLTLPGTAFHLPIARWSLTFGWLLVGNRGRRPPTLNLVMNSLWITAKIGSINPVTVTHNLVENQCSVGHVRAWAVSGGKVSEDHVFGRPRDYGLAFASAFPFHLTLPIHPGTFRSVRTGNCRYRHLPLPLEGKEIGIWHGPSPSDWQNLNESNIVDVGTNTRKFPRITSSDVLRDYGLAFASAFPFHLTLPIHPGAFRSVRTRNCRYRHLPLP